MMARMAPSILALLHCRPTSTVTVPIIRVLHVARSYGAF